jgi:hypothetical protein
MSEKFVQLPQGAPDPHAICDREFMDDVAQLKALRSYMIRQAKSPEAGAIEIGELNSLHFDEKGRRPADDEWQVLEHRSNDLFRLLSEADRRRFLYGRLPSAVVRTGAILGAISVGALVLAFAASLTATAMDLAAKPSGDLWVLLYRWSMFVLFLTWVAALAGTGSIAFIGTNALAVQDDVTFDITNARLIVLRVVLGALFGVTLALPIGIEPFTSFISNLYNAPPPTSDLVMKSLLLIVPFLLGFSTTLVITILNQSLDALLTFFGKKSGPPPVVAAGAQSGPPPVAAAGGQTGPLGATAMLTSSRGSS